MANFYHLTFTEPLAKWFSWWRTTAILHWLDYVTESEVDITALTHWLDCVSQVPPFATRQTLALPWQTQTSPRFLLQLRQTNILFLFGLWCFFKLHQSH